MQASILQVCRNIDENTQFMSPSRQALFLYIYFNILLNQRKPHTIEKILS